MLYRNFIAGVLAVAMASALAGCSDKKADSDTASQGNNEDITEEVTEEKIPPVPTEATDVNTVTFDDGVFSFAEAVSDDEQSATGTLSVEELMGNKMLKFTDDGKIALDGKVQKIKISASKLLAPENLPKVRRIEFDLYAQATDDKFVNEDGENVFVPGWIGGGGGTVTAKNDKWYDFAEFSGGEYDFEVSGAVHGEFKFLLADSGLCWSEDMEDANFLIMRWGISNESNIYIDNIVFYDEDNNSIPIEYQEEKSDENEEDTAAEEETSDEQISEEVGEGFDED